MKAVWSDHFPAAEKPPETISPCKTKGLWSEIFPTAEEPSPLPPPRHERCLICPKCNAASCHLLTSSTSQNPGRMFYICPAPALDHKFFKWADEVKPHELIDVPYCGGCMAGVCRVRKEKSGPNAGRILFLCRIKEGEGSCGYKVWKDELEVLSTTQANERISSSQSKTCVSTSTSPVNSDFIDNNKQSGEVVDYESPPVIDNSSNLQCVGVTSANLDQLQCHKPSVSSSRPNKRCRDGDLEDASSPLDSSSAVQDKTPENSSDLITLTRNLLRVESPPFKPDQDDEISGIKPFHITLDAPSCSGETKIGNFMSKSISKAFGEAGEHLQNDLLTLLETMDVKEHKAMSEAAEATFAALDRLLFNHQQFKKRATKFINSAMLLSEIEQSILPENESYQKLVDHCSSEKMRLDEITSAHTKVVDNVTSNRKRLKDVQEEISSARDWLFQIEAELLCCEVEMRNMEHELEKISKKKEVLEGNYMVASKELEESQKLHEKKEADRNAAKAAFDRARALLRG